MYKWGDNVTTQPQWKISGFEVFAGCFAPRKHLKSGTFQQWVSNYGITIKAEEDFDAKVC